MISLGLALLRVDTTKSSTHGGQQTEIHSETSDDQSKRKSVGMSTKESRSTEHWPTMPYPQ
jgi:hypothetical protein